MLFCCFWSKVGLGLSFKPNTDDVREAPSLTIIEELVGKGAFIRTFDPVAMGNAKQKLNKITNIEYCNNEYDAISGSHAVVIITEWNQFRSLDLAKVNALLLEPFFFALRNIYTREIVEQAGLRYSGVGV